ncbi:UDP-galactose transporter 1 [Fulvia fulva]|uniref:UDP-galactose transporter homolog 1 n=1 Tax=Passalora fulva TaxID=5499 RepID=A0A9Q8P3L9_PASFU|nr:UDP-galactose transporter 1 [Fulvia fulva]KAK4636061.1 UDP-galactose transporter 1 [Fulvia fulva]UJO12073.1 UDP-galactose transporter 1 [Fulvia fulva]WPV08853.1 UDP-galactose transporter 1 [Fulvia fulva]WPV23342.1 UDP-galactose transporter 1 [Fulvia fulva]
MATQNGSIRHRQPDGNLPNLANGPTIAGKNDVSLTTDSKAKDSANTTNLFICVGGIYASFLTWGVLQERITTTNYGTETSREVFKYPVVINTVQSLFAAALGYVYILLTRKHAADLPIYPSKKILWPLSLVAVTSSLASPFGYASLQHVDYITFILAKSCKLLPVMFLHVTLYRKKYPFYKYAVVALVTAGVAVFTLHSGSGSKKKGNQSGNSIYGLGLLGVNLLFDGLTNSTQDDIYASFRPYTGQQMMCALNIMSTFLTSTFLLVSPYLVQSGLGALTGIDVKGAGELQEALSFVQRHPAVGWDILGFAACGAMGQVFIFMTLSIFGSLLLVTVTVTRKMLTMILSVVWFGHTLSAMQWLGVGLVFGGVGVEAQLSKREKERKMKEKKAKA